jgi:hypothetical protein
MSSWRCHNVKYACKPNILVVQKQLLDVPQYFWPHTPTDEVHGPVQPGGSCRRGNHIIVSSWYIYRWLLLLFVCHRNSNNCSVLARCQQYAVHNSQQLALLVFFFIQHPINRALSRERRNVNELRTSESFVETIITAPVKCE